MNFSKKIEDSPFIITEGSIVERLRRNPAIQLDPHILSAALVYDKETAAVLANLYREYLDTGKKYLSAV